MQIKCLNVIGVERSGTNWLEVLLRDNVCTEVWPHKKHEPRPQLFTGWNREYGNKMKDAGFSNDNVGYVAIIKNPWAWAVSFTKKVNWKVKPRFNITGKELPNDLKLCIEHYWNGNNLSYINMAEKYPDRFMVVTYDDMILNDWRKTIRKIASHFDIELNRPLRNTPKTIGANRKVHNKKFNYDYYNTKQYLQKLTKSEIRWINNNANARVMTYCGFAL